MFERQDNDLIYKAQISLEMVRKMTEVRTVYETQIMCKNCMDPMLCTQALTGFSVEVETLDGRIINVPINETVQ